MSKVIYKPIPSKPGKPPVVLIDGGSKSQAPTITHNGKVYQGKYLNNEGTVAQYVFPGLPIGVEGAELSYGDQKQTINTGQRFEGDSIGGLKGSYGRGSINDTPGGTFPGQAGYGPTPYGSGYLPAYLGNQFPMFQPIQYNPMAVPNYTQFDPATYAQKYSPVIRSEMLKNFNFAEGLSFNTLADELKGLKAYAPAAAALARTTAAEDTIQNQALRTGQLKANIPDVLAGLKKQTSDAAAYASGHLPDTFDDNALEVGIRSDAADIATSRGFGVRSGASRNLSDYMNTKERFQISQYGNQLQTQNAQTRAALELAPTEFINAGQAINPNPSISPSQLIGSNFSQANQLGTIPASTALQSSIGQSQFQTNLVKDVGMFNTQNQLQTSMYNASNVYAAQMGFFNYNQGYANTAADVATATKNQQMLMDQFNKSMSQAQKANTIQQILGGLGVAPNIIKAISGLFGSDSSGTGVPSLDQYPSLMNPGDILNYDNYAGGPAPLTLTGSGDYQFNIPSEFGFNYGIDYPSFSTDLSL